MDALIFANGEIDDGEMVRRALDHAPDALIVAADGGVRVAAHYGLRVDTVIGDMDSLPADDLAALADRARRSSGIPPRRTKPTSNWR